MPETHKKSDKHEDLRENKEEKGANSPLPEWTEIFKTTAAIGLFSMFVVSAIGSSINFSIMPFWSDEMLQWTEREVGFMMMSIGIVIALIQTFLIGPLFTRFGELRILMLGGLIQIIGAVFVIYVPAHPLLAPCLFLMITSGATLWFPSLNGLVSRLSDQRLQGTALGFANGLSSLGRVVGPLTAGLLFSATHPGYPFWGIIACSLIIIVWAAIVYKKVTSALSNSAQPTQ